MRRLLVNSHWELRWFDSDFGSSSTEELSEDCWPGRYSLTLRGCTTVSILYSFGKTQNVGAVPCRHQHIL